MQVSEFKNEPFSDFSEKEVRESLKSAIAKVKSEFGREYPDIIGGKPVTTQQKLSSINPAHPNHVVGVVQRSSPETAIQALEVAEAAFKSWSKTTPEPRADFCFRVAEILRRRKMEFTALMILEVGKTWPEADAEIAELIDFVEWYGREALRYGSEQPVVQLPGESDHLHYVPLGVGVVISPWNFPVAIMGGMTTAAISAGNTVILKPSENSPTCSVKFMEVLEEAGIPPGVVNLVTGTGKEVGETLVVNPRIRFVSFTGSRAVGIHINELAAEPRDGQRWIKRVIAEMGGKNAIIVDEEADIEAAAQGVMQSAYGYQGQKCSACSRAIVDVHVHDEFLDLLIEKTENINVGDPTEQSTFMGPLISDAALDKTLSYIEIGRDEGELILGGNQLPRDGYFIAPTIFEDVDQHARIAQEEIFGPVVSIMQARNFEHALEIANDTDYGLTGSVYSRNHEKLTLAAEEFQVGNLYFNRKSTGAMVGVHPFGGFNMSGTDSKAGGRDYLGLFSQAKAIAEKVA